MTRLDRHDIMKIAVDCPLVNQLVNNNRMTFNPDLNTTKDNLAYVIYTSGTTGQPKGVMVEHGTVAAFRNDVKYRDIGHNDSNAMPEAILFLANYGFDMSIEQLVLSILSSNMLIIISNTFTFDENFYAYLNANRMTYMSITPSQLQEIDLRHFKHLKLLALGGEPLSEMVFDKIRAQYIGKVRNVYGLTETTIGNVFYIYETDMKYKNSMGTTLSNTKAFVLNNRQQMLPVNVVGELYLTGNCVSRGYLNRPDLTAQRFLPNPFQTEEEKKEGKNSRIYKTGDLVRWLPDGELEYLGRNDFQVKIRGLRIELGEIEAVLSSYQGVKQAVVCVRDAKTVEADGRNRKYLLGYFVSETSLLETDIKQYMQTKLPDYMIPNRLIRIEKIPVNINGKLDSQALPEVDFSMRDQNQLVPPRNDLESKIIRIWSDVLEITMENIGIHDDFFSLGGDSILVVKLSLMITNLIAHTVTVMDLFENRTIAKLASHILHEVDYTAEQNNGILKINADYSNYPNFVLSFAQERLLFINDFAGENGTNAYNVPIFIQFSNNNVRRDLLYQSLLAILHRHEILRTLVQEDKFDVISQHILNDAETDALFKVDELQVVNKEQLDAELFKFAKYVFNLRKELPIKVTFYERKNTDGSDSTTLYMGILMHHICFDGWSLNIFWREMKIFYNYFHGKAINTSLDNSSYLTSNLPTLPVQYKDFAAWQRKYLRGERLHNLSKFWKSKLDDFEMLNLISDISPRLPIYDYSGDDIMFELNEQTTTALKELAKNLQVSLFSLLLSAYAFMLSNYTNQQDIVIGTPVANRNQPELENLIGFFVNLLVLRIKLDSHDCAIDFIKKVNEEVINAQIYQEMPFEGLVKELQIEYDASRHPIVQVIFIMNSQFETTVSNTHKSNEPEKSLEMSEYLSNRTNFKIAKYDITTSIDEIDICLKGHFNFATKVFHQTTIQNFIGTYIHILTLFSRLSHNCRLENISCIDSKQHSCIERWQNTCTPSTEFNTQSTLQKLFEEEVEKSGDNIAIVYSDVQLSYRELNEKANQLAHYLRSICDIQPDDLIALLLDKSELMIVSILAVWKSGAAYVPIDPSYPVERFQFILQDTRAKIMITNKKYMARLDPHDIMKIAVDCPLVNQLVNSNRATCNPDSNATKDNLAYVIYTSGTTGEPKGVMVQHGSVISFRDDIIHRYFSTDYNENSSQTILFISNYVFDFSIEQIALSILSSNTLIVPENTFIMDQKFYSYLNEKQLTYLSITPSHLQHIDLKQLKYLRTLTVAGEELPERAFERIRREYHGKVINAYGITETTVYNMVYVYENDMKYKNSIGFPLSNAKQFVLNKNMQMLPVHAVGELYLTGDCVTRGYLNRPELTAERFLSNPFQTEEEKKTGKNARIYKTGDLVRWLPNGELEYRGRNDLQVKIRGLRIELGEIESVLSSYQGVRECAVLVKDHKKKNIDTLSTKYLVGYFVSDVDTDECVLKEYMQRKLPDYMIPNRLIQIDKMPVNISGKLNTRVLPEVDFSKSDHHQLVLPQNDLETKMVYIWSELFRFPVEKISVNNDFFSLGGDSILAIKLSLMITNSLSIKLTVAAIFQNRTIAKLASHILHGLDCDASENDRIMRINTDFRAGSNYALSFAQERLWFITEFEGEIGTDAYNVPIFIQFSNNNVRRDLLYQSLLAILHRHEILRTLMHEDKFGVISQHLLNDAETAALFKVHELHVVNKQQLDAELFKFAKYVFNLRKELPIKVTFYEMKNEDVENNTRLYMGILMHHICFDGWSMKILWSELQIFYEHFERNLSDPSLDISSYSDPNLSVLPVQYKDFAEWQRKYLRGERLHNLSEYWKSKLDGFEMLNLIPDNSPRPSIYNYSGDEIMFEINEQITTALKALAKSLHVSLFSLLLSAYAFMLSNYTNQQDIVIGTPVANRNQPELENLIGFFVNLLVLRIKLDSHDCAIDFIKKVNEEVINAQINQEMPFDALVKQLQINKDTSRHPIVQVIFVMNTHFQTTLTGTDKTIVSSKSLGMSEYLSNHTNFRVAKYDIAASIDEIDVSLKGNFNFATNIFHHSTMHNFIESYVHILTQFSRIGEKCRIQDIMCASSKQRSCIERWQNTCTAPTELNTQTTLHKLFEAEAATSYDRIAVIYQDIQLTYRELNEKANQLAHYLRSICDIQPDDLIALCLDKSELMIVSILAVWKSGAAYVPIDPTYPVERFQFILQDTRAKIMITNKKYMARLDPHGIMKIAVDCPLVNQLVNSNRTTCNPDSNATKDNLAYVIYTSGTTGEPKAQITTKIRLKPFYLFQTMYLTFPLNK
ncbi:unnamed protein product [Rotaria socialis]|uniref:Carrier domain-containing protein n=1 Tax=Rotaria socialis TaxID=392032 RepID=A0A820X166_9BILA|nr:unnamed protein product [Rotaria socialis]